MGRAPELPGGVDEFFADCPLGLTAHEWLLDVLGAEVPVRVTKSQVAYSLRRGFAYLWRPGQYVRSDVPVVLSLGAPDRIDSPRWKEVVRVRPTLWMHHLEVRSAEDLDDEVTGWVVAARDAADGD